MDMFVLCRFSCVRLFVNPWSVARQAPLSMGFSRQEYWSGLPCPSPGDLPNPGIKPRSPALQEDSLPSEPNKSFISQLIHTHCNYKVAVTEATCISIAAPMQHVLITPFLKLPLQSVYKYRRK